MPRLPQRIARAFEIHAPALLELEDGSRQYETRIHEVDFTHTSARVWLLAPTEKGELVTFDPRQRLTLLLPTRRGVVRCPATYLYTTKDLPTAVVVQLANEEEITIIQKRRAVRVPVVLELRYSREPREGTITGSPAAPLEMYPATALDISATGIRMHAKEALEEGETIRLDIPLPTRLHLRGKVVQVFQTPADEELAKGETPIFTYGIEFLDLDPKAVEELHRFVLHQEVKMLQKEKKE